MWIKCGFDPPLSTFEGGNVDRKFIRSHLRAPFRDQMWMDVGQIHI